MKALVLGGGSLKGSWQVGAIQAVLETGFKPDMIYGISAGALNATFMVHEVGKQVIAGHQINWDLVNKKLITFWLENINDPADIGIPKSKITMGYETMMSRFDGLIDTNPLDALMRRTIDMSVLRRSPIALKVGTVNINTGEMHYADPIEQHYMDYLRASSSLPIIMPAIQIGGDHKKAFMDGGLREVVPLRKAIEDGADEIYAIATHPKQRNMEDFNYRSLFNLIERIKDITVNQFENSDIEWAENYSKNMFGVGGFHLAQKIKLTVIRPEETLKIDLTKFDKKDIREMIKSGYEFAYTQLKKK
jgi:NTE family protein